MSTRTGKRKTEKPVSLLGVDKNKIKIFGDIVEPLDIEWEAGQREMRTASGRSPRNSPLPR
ncbi:MAG: hypothetical protein F4030_09170 [Gammaproteobacteria bacterium]|nr:hypothetical protein [Gammaproteobacteria bacterium]MYH85576.1 hypothetical protein [Gammaproteobacteria bacterium]MYK05138.1 hypothetical protein [Gammaproteobacteria bacterium]